MLCELYGPRGARRLMSFEATPSCGEDFCDECGDCLDCYNGDGCMDGGEWDNEAAHRWVLYHEDAEEFIQKHELPAGRIKQIRAAVRAAAD